MAEASSTELSPQQLIAKYRGYYFFLQMRTLILGAALLTAAAAFFAERQIIAMVSAVAIYDLYRLINVARLHHEDTGRWFDAEINELRRYFLFSSPRRWLEYALLALPANAALTYLLHGGSPDAVQNLSTYTLGVLSEAVSLVAGEVSDLTAGLASLVVDFGVVGILEYIAARWLFSKRKLSFKEKT
ncbi:hypothetical protein [Maricaulis maris]|jgi:hypothetical protein|uniref:hypothetical protein n=1 Tax=Maricaulis maris TaxID=74318 RepID=UPI0026EC1960|nr:hypothetical protein [Maricaulis maris]